MFIWKQKSIENHLPQYEIRELWSHQSIQTLYLGLYKGTAPNIARNCIINVGETVVYDAAKDGLIASGYFVDGIPCHFTAAVTAGFCATVLASPVDVIKTR